MIKFIKYFLLCNFFAFLTYFSAQAQIIVATGDRCTGNDIQFSLVPQPANIDSLVWTFNDPTSGVDSVSRALRPKHRFNNPGTYKVNVRVYAGANPIPQSFLFTTPGLTINASPKEFDFGADTTICPNETIILDPYGARNPPQPSDAPAPAGVTYLWSTGETTQTISVNKAGCYSVTVSNGTCTFSDKINVEIYRQEVRQGGRWYFGNNAGIDFRSGTATAVTDGQVNTFEGSSSVSDLNGRLLFYSDGTTVYDSTGAVMPDTLGLPVTGANGLNGSPVSTQSVLIVPQPDDKGCQSLYYIFTAGAVPGGQGLQYSVVDMRLNAGKGAVTEKNVPVVPSTRFPGVSSSEKLTAYTNQAGQTFIISHDVNGNNFRVIPLTQAGLDLTRIRTFNSITNFTDPANSQGQMKISPDGTKMAITIPGAAGQPNYVEIYEFIDSTGVIRNPIRMQVGNSPPPVYGLEFSQDGSVLYVTTQGSGSGGVTAGDTSSLYQFDVIRLDSATIARSRVRLDSSNTLVFGALQVASDQQIYMAIQNSQTLSVIQNPSGIGIQNAGYTRQSFDLQGRTSQLGLPNFVQSFFQPAGGQGFTYRDTCSGGPTQFFAFPDLTGSTFAWDFGDGGTSSQQNPTHIYTGAGIKNVRLTIVNRCTTEVFNQNITILRSPDDFTLGQNIVLCPGQTRTLDPYPGQAGPLGAVYLWSTPAGIIQSKTITASLPGTYFVQVSVAQCFKTGSVQVTNSNVAVSLGNDTTFCESGQKILNAGNPGATYQWFQNRNPIAVTTQTLTVTTSGEYIVAVTDPITSCVGRDTVNITVTNRAIPTVVNRVPASGCGAADGSITISVSPAGSYNFIWTKTQGTPIGPLPNATTVNNLTAGVYQVVIQPQAGTAACDTVIRGITIDEPTGITSVQQVITNVTTCNGSNGTITLTVSPTGSYAFSWRNQITGANVGTNSNILTGVPAGTYSVQITQGLCSQFVSGLIITEPIRPTVTIQGPPTQNICLGTNTALVAASSDNSTNDPDFTWTLNGNPAGSGRSLTVTQSGNYIVTYRNPTTQCQNTASVQVTVSNPPPVNVADPAAVCQGTSVTLDAGNGGGGGNIVYQWTLQGTATVLSNSQTFTTTQAGTYQVLVRNTATGCQATDVATVTVNPIPVANAGTDVQICRGTPITIRATGGQAGASVYTLQPGNISNAIGIFSVTPLTTTTFTITVNNNGGGTNCSSSDDILVTVLPQPTVNLGPDRTYCESALQTLDATFPGATYLWSTNQITATIRPSVSGRFWVRVTLGACVASDTVNITVTPGIRATAPLKEVPLCLSDPGTPQATLQAGGGTGFTYSWRRSGTNLVLGTEQRLQVTSVGAYVVDISNGTSCTLTDTIRVTERCDAILQVPQAFTPNGDGQNENLEIFGTLDRVIDFEMLIFNRWGESIFQSNSVTDTWDGRFKGVQVPPGSYAWKIKFKSRDFPERGTIVRQGGVLVIR